MLLFFYMYFLREKIRSALALLLSLFIWALQARTAVALLVLDKFPVLLGPE